MPKALVLSSLTADDELAVRSWPSYPAEVKELDYALRENGWLAQVPATPGNHRFAARLGDALVGFSILAVTGHQDAEFYIALHPTAIGQGLGKAITQMVVQRGFEQMELQQIHLKVRSWHERAIRLYEGLGFRRTGVTDLEIDGKQVNFVVMQLDRSDAI